MTDEQIKAIEARCAAATPGPWRAEHKREDDYAAQVTAGKDGTIADLEHAYDEQDMIDATFIAHARTDIPALLAALKAAQAEADKWRTSLLEEREHRSTVAEQLRKLLVGAEKRGLYAVALAYGGAVNLVEEVVPK
jgi:hypothetical protein